MSICKRIIESVCPIPQIEQYQRFLFIGPHPDDIEIGAGATVSKLISEGKTVSFIICTDGRYGTDNLDKEISCSELVEIRKKEAVSGAMTLGVNQVKFLEFSDGSFYKEEDLKRQLLINIAQFSPDVIFCPDPTVQNECHPDHLNVGNAVRKTAILLNNPGIMNQYSLPVQNLKAIAFYMTSKYNSYVITSLSHLAKQIEAIEKHTSQYPPQCEALKALKTYLKVRSCINGAKVFRTSAEGFRVLGTTHMHCLPEIGE